MNKDEFIELLKGYDFIKNSVQSFCTKYKINPKTVRKYLQENSIEYNKRTIIVDIKRDANGRYCETTDRNKVSVYSSEYRQTRNKINSDHRSELSHIDINNMTYEEKLKFIYNTKFN